MVPIEFKASLYDVCIGKIIIIDKYVGKYCSRICCLEQRTVTHKQKRDLGECEMKAPLQTSKLLWHEDNAVVFRRRNNCLTHNL